MDANLAKSKRRAALRMYDLRVDDWCKFTHESLILEIYLDVVYSTAGIGD